jgi:ABC-type nickel/cobalt efflux system permease component RcnA
LLVQEFEVAAATPGDTEAQAPTPEPKPAPKQVAEATAQPAETTKADVTASVSAEPTLTVVQGRRAPAPAQSKTASEMLERVTDVLRTKDLTLPMVVLALLISAVLGMGHAFSPGHGKTVMAAYLIGERGTIWHAIVLGFIVTVTHVWSILALGVVSLYFTDRMSEQQFTFWTGVVSGTIIVLLGLFLLKQRYTRYVLSQPAGGLEADESGHHHLISVEGEPHSPNDGLDHTGLPTDGEAYAHSHGMFSHSHVIDGEGGKPPTYKSILWLGISGGIVPCPAAFIVLMLAINLGRLALGLLLILSFSVGLAAVLVGIGIAVVRASGHVRKRIGARSRILVALPVFSAALITLLGIGLVVQTLIQHGVIIIPAARG